MLVVNLSHLHFENYLINNLLNLRKAVLLFSIIFSFFLNRSGISLLYDPKDCPLATPWSQVGGYQFWSPVFHPLFRAIGSQAWRNIPSQHFGHFAFTLGSFLSTVLESMHKQNQLLIILMSNSHIFQRWAISKFSESYLRWKLPLKKYGMIPSRSFLQDISSCQVAMLPENFYERVEQGSIILKKSQTFSFCREGLVIDGESQPLRSDLVILATGYRGDQKLKNMFSSPIFQNHIIGSPSLMVPLYR